MVLLSITLSAASLGWAFQRWTSSILDRARLYHQGARLKALLVPVRSGNPLLLYQSILDRAVDRASCYGWFRDYLRFLEKAIERAGMGATVPSQVIGGQVLCAAISASLFAALSWSFWVALFAAVLGSALPLIRLRDKVVEREANLLRELPDALDVLSLCSEAGLSLERGMDHYLGSARPSPLTEVFSGILEQARSGSSRASALERASAKLDLVDFSLFTSSLVQAERFGTGISQTLRQLSLTLRDKQSQRAEKAAQEMPVKLLFPLIFFILPVTFLVIFGPLLLQLSRL